MDLWVDEYHKRVKIIKDIMAAAALFAALIWIFVLIFILLF
jgi:diacylglycerol kinase